MAARTLEDCPPEVLHQIYRQVCADGGATARALALVSRYIRDTSAPFRYFSLVLVGAQVLEFAKLLEHRPSEAAHVRHLFIADHTARWRPALDRHLQMTRLGRWIGRAHGAGLDMARITVSTFEDAVKRVLRAVEATLKTLYLLMPAEPHFLLVPNPLPMLEHLTLFAHRAPGSNHRYLSTNTMMPSLRSLEVIAGDPSDVYALTGIVPLCPALESLKITLGKMLWGFPHTLSALLQDEEMVLRTVDPLPEGVTRVLVDLPRVPNRRWRGPSDVKYMCLLAESSRPGRLHINLTRRREDNLREIRKEARDAWVRRMEDILEIY